VPTILTPFNKTFQIYGRVDNILDSRYATYGTFFELTCPTFTNGPALTM